jgi:hypothetical protein
VTETKRHSQPQRLSCPGLSLALYREVAAHLRQVEGVTVALITQTATEFDYFHSQIEGLWLSCPLAVQAQVEAILQYYAQRHGAWQRGV